MVSAEKPETRFVIVTGLSGAGKTQAARCLEDLGFFCVDNLPPILIPKFVELLEERQDTLGKVALVMDIRGGRFFQGLFEALDFLEEQKRPYEILFLEATDEVLIRRYKETRRRHPMSQQGRVLEGILEERSRLEELRGRANKVVDTSDLSPQEFRQQVTELFSGEQRQLNVSIISFGFKYGIPLDADLVMDVRFLPNPHYVEELRPHSGLDRDVEEYVLSGLLVQEFLNRFESLIRFLIPHYVAEGKMHLVVALGCTGGRHRSVVLAEHLGAVIKDMDCRVTAKHRDIARGG